MSSEGRGPVEAGATDGSGLLPIGATFEDESADGWPDSVGIDRRRARAVAVQVLYEVDLTRHEPAAVTDRRLADDATPEKAVRVVRHLVQGVVARRPEVDAILAECAPQWPVDRIDPVERAILRLATFELMHGRAEATAAPDRVPLRVAINEAVELARLFGTEASVRFVNGVLGAVVRKYSPGATDGGDR